MPKITIAFIHGALDCRGGAERKLLLLAQHLHSRPDVDLTIYTLRLDRDKTFTVYLPGLRIVEVARPGLLGRLRALWDIARMTTHADLIHAHNHPAQFAAVMSKWRRRKPIVWFQNEPALYVEGAKTRASSLKLLVLRALERCVVPFIDLVVANSEHTAGHIRRAIRRDSVVIYSGVDTDRLTPPVAKPDVPHVLLVSRLEEEKNIGFFLSLANAFPRYRFVLAGNGTQESAIRDQIARERIANIDLRINVSEEEKNALYQTSSLFAFPTRHEPLGVTVIEALACGLPVVAFNSGGPRETVEDGVTGYLVETDDEFRARVRGLLEDAPKRAAMGAAARQRAVERFSLVEMLRKTIECYNRLLQQYGNERTIGN